MPNQNDVPGPFAMMVGIALCVVFLIFSCGLSWWFTRSLGWEILRIGLGR